MAIAYLENADAHTKPDFRAMSTATSASLCSNRAGWTTQSPEFQTAVQLTPEQRGCSL